MESITKATAEDFCKERPQRPVWKICEEFEDKQLAQFAKIATGRDDL